jgi:hypothetical protein
MQKTFFGKNNLSSKNLFHARRDYKYLAIPDTGIEMVDFWYDDALYGKIDSQGNAIYPITSGARTVKPLRANVEMIDTLFFVEDAYYELKSIYTAYVMEELMKPLPAYDTFTVKHGIKSVDDLYDKHLRQVMSFFIDDYLPQFDSCIRTFEDLAGYFIRFMKEHGLSAPVTKTGFIMLPTTPNSISGLILDLEYGPQSRDSAKESFFSEDLCHYESFLSLAAKHGFLLDKNAPWRLVANVRSEAISPKMFTCDDCDPRPLNPEHVFETNYFKSYKDDMLSLYGFLFNAHQIYFRKNPNIFVAKERKHGIIVSVPYAPSTRSSETSPGLVKKFFPRVLRPIGVDLENSNFWFEFLLRTRLLETVRNRKMCEKVYRQNFSSPGIRVGLFEEKTVFINELVKSYDERLSPTNRMLDKYTPSKATSTDRGHRHIYVIDGNGNGYTEYAYHPDESEIKHRHKIENYRILPAKSACFPRCQDRYGFSGVGPHGHYIRNGEE